MLIIENGRLDPKRFATSDEEARELFDGPMLPPNPEEDARLQVLRVYGQLVDAALTLKTSQLP
jgi:hypothetical protein